MSYGKGDPREWRGMLEGWKRVGATHISLVTTNCGLATPAAHIAPLRKFAEEL